MSASMMKAAVVHEAGGPEVLKIEQRPVPVPLAGQIVIRVKAFGLNRSELFTRQGHSPNVRFPRVLGIEAVGLVEDAPGGEFAPGDVVATVRGGLGRNFDGGYAEYAAVPAAHVRADRVCRASGAPAGFDKVLELVGTSSLLDSLQCAGERGLVCLTGMVGNAWSFDEFDPMEAIPTSVCLTSYAGENADFMAMPLQALVDRIEAGSLRVQVGRVFQLDDIVEAHRTMEENRGAGKIVVRT
jgi:NADPH:quinone reductase-like Zn-dependent oxidoreductase